MLQNYEPGTLLITVVKMIYSFRFKEPTLIYFNIVHLSEIFAATEVSTLYLALYLEWFKIQVPGFDF